MSKDSNPPNLFNPMMLWTDLGMRALEMSLSSSQNIGDGLDRLTRAGAGPERSEDAHSLTASDGQAQAALPTSSGVALAAQMQRATFDLMTQAWQQWINALGTFVSLGAGARLGETVARQNPLINAMSQALPSGSADDSGFERAAAGGASSRRQQVGGQRARRSSALEHGFAKSEPKRRTGGGRAKPKARSRNS